MNCRKRQLAPAELAELTGLVAQSPNGLLTPEAVLAQARDASSALHGNFTWDDGEAAEKWRLSQARDLIVRVTVEITPAPNHKPIRVRGFVSLGNDRIGGGGYRPIGTVLGDADLKKEMLRTALAELEALRSRYEHLKELVDVWRAVDSVRATGRKAPQKGATEKRKAA